MGCLPGSKPVPWLCLMCSQGRGDQKAGNSGEKEFLLTWRFLVASFPPRTPCISSFPCAEPWDDSEQTARGLRELVVSTQALSSQGAGGCGGEAQRGTPDLAWGNPGWLPVRSDTSSIPANYSASVLAPRAPRSLTS